MGAETGDSLGGRRGPTVDWCLLVCLQGQMDEDVQKALKQILMMCKVSAPPKDAC